MGDPITISAAITGIVALMSAYLRYRVDMAKEGTSNEQVSVEKPTVELAHGKLVTEEITDQLAKHGTSVETIVLANYQNDSNEYENELMKTLKDIAERSPEFSQKLLTLARQVVDQSQLDQDGISISGESKVFGPVTGSSTGTISTSYTFQDDPSSTQKSPPSED